MIFSNSLAKTVDAVNEALFCGRSVSATEREGVADWITSRHGMAGCYANTFAPFPDEAREGMRVFTGERCKSASGRHIIGEEACRVLRLLDVSAKATSDALDEATRSLDIGPAELPRGEDPKPDDGKFHWLWPYRGGTFCCGPCTVGMWRHLLAGGFDHPEERLARGLKCLHDCRKGSGQWRVFPLWYTVLALVEVDLAEAREELRYAAIHLELAAKRFPAAQSCEPEPMRPWPGRRAELARRALARI